MNQSYFLTSENMIGSYGSKYEFKFHSDNPTYKIYPEYKQNSLNAPEFLSLFCIRGQKNVHTNVILLNDILNRLDQNTIDTLQQNIFIVNTPDSFDKYHEVENVSVIGQYKDKYYNRFDYHNIKGTNKKSQLALEKFIHIMEGIQPISLPFESGDFLIFKNQEVLHSRESFTAKYDGFDRWLLRVYSASNIGYLNHEEIIKGDIGCI